MALNSPISNPYVSQLPHDDNKDFSPRVGFAYDLTGKGQHVLRGGFGLYYGNVFQNIPLFMEQMSNPTVFQTVISLSSPTDIVTGTGIPAGELALRCRSDAHSSPSVHATRGRQRWAPDGSKLPQPGHRGVQSRL